jgi:S1-C subfamily serine protease
MIKLLVAAFLLLIPLSAFSQTREVIQFNEQMLRPTVQVLAGDSIGSGTVIYSKMIEDKATTFILTNYHVIANLYTTVEEWDASKGETIKVRVLGQPVVRFYNYHDTSILVSTTDKIAIILKTDAKHDLALLGLVDRVEVHPYVAILPKKDARFDQGETVWAVGGGRGLPPFASTGVLGYNHQYIAGANYILATSPITGGNSGGGLYRKNSNGDYELIGVPSRGFRDSNHIGFAMLFPAIRDFLSGPSGFILED